MKDLDFERKQLDYVAQQMLRSGILNLSIVCLLAVALFQEHNNLKVLAWLFFAWAVILPRYFLLTDVIGLRAESVNNLKAAVSGLSLLAGFVWGLALILFATGSSEPLFMLLTVTVTGFVAGGMPALGAYLPAYTAFALAAVVPMIIQYLAQGYVFFGILLGLYLLGMCALSRQISRVISRAMSIDEKNVELLADLTLAKEQAETANLSKSRFLASASHDLRQPLQSISLLIDALINRTEDGIQRDYLHHLSVSHQSMVETFNALLDISRIESGQLKVQQQHRRLSDILGPAIGEAKMLAEVKDLRFHVDIATSAVYTDPVLLGRALRNILDNAIKYTLNGSVSILSREDEQKVYIDIQDSGIGISKEQLAYIFDEYYQGDRSDLVPVSGVGLGLYSVKKIMDLLGHDIVVDSMIGEGTTVTLSLNHGKSDLLDLSHTEESEFPIEGTRVLIVDDEPMVLRAMEVLLLDNKCQVMKAKDLREARQCLSTHERPDIIVTDYCLAEGELGDELIEVISHEAGEPIPGIVISGNTDVAMHLKLEEKGMRLFSKPVRPDVLRKAIYGLTH